MSYTINIDLSKQELDKFEEFIEKDDNFIIKKSLSTKNSHTGSVISIDGNFIEIKDRGIVLEKYNNHYRFQTRDFQDVEYLKDLLNKYKLDFKLIGEEGEEI